MKPTWETNDGAIRLYCADCLNVLPTLEAGSVDACITDPPYGIGDKMQGGTWGAAEKYADFRQWDESPSTELLDAVRRAAPQIILWGANYFHSTPARCWLAWDKSNAVPTMADMELAWTNLDKPAKRYRGQVGVHSHGHPTEKPVGLMLWCLSHVPDAQTILDPFMGSGTTAVACIRKRRRFIGCEKEERYFDISVRRIQQELERFPLLEPKQPTQRSLLQ